MILKLLRALNRELKSRGAIGEVGLCGGAVMCLVFKAREATKDVDAIFHPTREIRLAAKAVGEAHGLPADWLNDAAKAYFYSEPPRENVLNLPNLRVWAPRADYLLAMKCVAARYDTHDQDDVLFLLNHLGLKAPEAVFRIIERYYPSRLIPAKTRFLIEEIMGKK